MSASIEEGDEIEMSADGESVVHIVSVDGSKGKELEASHIRTLASIIRGSTIIILSIGLGEETAKEALIYHYKHVASGFSPKLTVKQVSIKYEDQRANEVKRIGRNVMDKLYQTYST